LKTDRDRKKETIKVTYKSLPIPNNHCQNSSCVYYCSSSALARWHHRTLALKENIRGKVAYELTKKGSEGEIVL